MAWVATTQSGHGEIRAVTRGIAAQVVASQYPEPRRAEWRGDRLYVTHPHPEVAGEWLSVGWDFEERGEQ